MVQFIHSKFTIDLTHLGVVFTDENQMFKDSFSTEISFPFPFEISETFAKNLEFNPHYNAKEIKITFPGKLNRDGQIVDAELTISDMEGRFASGVIKAGVSDFPNFSKKLPELPLENFAVPNIAAHALTIIPQNYPDVNYDFRMVHTDKYDPTDTEFFSFEKIINNYVDGAFPENSINSENIDIIRNIIQPFPYLIYVLKAAIEDAGYQLTGEILTDPDLNQALLFKDAEYYTKITGESIPLTILNTEYESLPYTLGGYIQHASYRKEVTITRKGNYKIFGSEIMYWFYSDDAEPETGFYFNPLSDRFFKLSKVSGGVTTVLQTYNFEHTIEGSISEYFPSPVWPNHSIDMNVLLEAGDTIIVEKIEARRDHYTSNVPYNPEVVSLDIFPLRFLNPDGSPILNTTNHQKIDLRLCVPNITVSELVTFIKNTENYSFITEGNNVVMNKIKPKFARQNAVDMKESEIPLPKRSFNNQRTFEMFYQDQKTNEKYNYDSAYFDGDGVKINTYTKKSNTSSIAIDGLPLPVIERNGIRTAYSLDDNPDKIRLIFRNPMDPDGLPLTFWNDNFTIPNLLNRNFLEWFTFRQSATKWQWESIISVEKFREIKINSLIYAYDNYHLFTEVEKERIDLLWWRILIKTECLT